MQQPSSIAAIIVASPSESGIPLRKRQVAADDHRSVLVPVGDDLEEMPGFFARERQVAELVDDEQLRALIARRMYSLRRAVLLPPKRPVRPICGSPGRALRRC